ncbi:MAG: hypothetical protein M3220_10380 [Chloroflexota bacterium]|nr:hypothetical protein [Chloroflexota bacterium]
MSDFTFDLATPADDAAIRELLRESAVPGHITVSYQREPDYFAGCGTMGPFWQVPVARHLPTGALAGLGCRALRPLFVNGRVEEVGYLGQLRVATRFQGRWLLPAAFRFLRSLHDDGRARGYLTTIIAGNEEARGLLVDKPRRHYPTFREVASLHTIAILLRRSRGGRASPSEVGWGNRSVLPEIVAFLREQGAEKQFYPAYSEEDFVGPLTRGFQLEDLAIVRHGGRIAGVAGLWDQSAYKQSVVRAYSGTLARQRPLIGAAARLVGMPPLPPPGQPIRLAYASFICIADNDPATFRILLRHLCHRAATRGYTFLMVGLAASDPLLAVARESLHVTYRSTLYTACWEDGGSFHEQLDKRIPYVEIASL